MNRPPARNMTELWQQHDAANHDPGPLWVYVVFALSMLVVIVTAVYKTIHPS